jgi:hypothetical protein
MSARLLIDGRVVDQATSAGLAGVAVRATSSASEAALATCTTDRLGAFEVELGLDAVTARVVEEGVRFAVELGEHTDAFVSDVFGIRELVKPVELAVPEDVLAGAFPKASLTLLDDSGPIDELEVGQSLALTATGLRPVSRHTVTLHVDAETYSTQELTSDQFGRLPLTIVAPQFGLAAAGGREPLTWQEAQRRWDGLQLVVEVHAGDACVARHKLAIRGSGRRPNGFVSDAEGHLRNAVNLGRDELFVSLTAMPKASSVRVFVVPRQGDWVLGDPIAPAVDATGRAFVVDAESTGSPIRIASAEQLVAGAFDLVARPMRYGFEADEDLFLSARDVVIGRRHTGLVVREDWLLNGPILDGPVNKVQIAGSPVGERPYFKYRETFAVGEDVWAALDPGIVAPGQLAHKAALYVIASKTAAQWGSSTALTHVPPGAPTEVVLQSFCINANKTLVWPGASQIGTYDVIADFGNNDPDPAAFAKDDDYDSSLDMIDGYLAPGFRIVNDPGTTKEFANVGGFSIDAGFLTAMGQPTSMTVNDESGGYFIPGAFATVARTFPRQALVRFPADVAGATSVSQISTARPDYPLVMIVHGQGHAYTNYAFLLDHLAANGFVAMSIHLQSGIHGLARANAFFNHLTLINTICGSKLQNNVGVLGHSRGGEAVFKIARLNASGGLGIGLNGMIALSPTDQYGRETINGAAATPLHVLYGAKDNDVDGGPPYVGYNVRQSGFSLYDRTDDKDKSMTFVEDATHNGFVTTNEASPAPLLSEADQRKVLLAEANAFFRMTLRSESEWTGMFNGEWRAPSVAASPAKTHPQYRSMTRRAVDDFEGAHTATSWQTSTAGGAVVQSGLPVDPIETQLFPQDNQSPHDTGGLRMKWDTATDRIDFAIPVGEQDVSSFAALSFSVTRVAGSASNPGADPQNFRVVLRDGGGSERSIRAGAFGMISKEAAANTPGNVKSAMTTIRIPLSSYTVVCASVVPVDLTKVTNVRFDFTETATGDVSVDNLEFSA